MPMVIVDAQIDGHPVLLANDSFLSLTGFSRAEIIGRGVAVLLEPVTDPHAISMIEDALDSSLAGTWECRCRRANDDGYLARIFLSPLVDEQGKVRQHFLGFVELNDQIDRLAEQRRQINALYDLAPGFVVSLEGRDHRITFANASYKRLVGRGDLVGHRLCDVLPEVATQGFIALLDRVLETGEPFLGYGVPIQLSTPSAATPDTKYLNFMYQPVRGPDGTITGVFVEGYDVTAERLAANRLSLLQGEVAHASRVNAMGMMAATLAHELNQPLAAIANYAGASAHLVDPTQPGRDALMEALRGIEEAAQRAGHIIRNVRELTKRGETPKVRFNLKAAIAECVKLVRASGCPAAIIEDRTPEDLMVFADRLQIQQVAINLLRNACDAIAGTAGGVVTVDATRKQVDVEIHVTDTGHGLSLEAAENIFHWMDSSKDGGTGLGLAISRTMIEAQSGRIWLERSDQSGSEFCFTVPAASHVSGGAYGN
ncbi:PAS domain-containing protein [Sphingomonas sp. S1-29]|uniref:PAS domain-containing sensor histidine kinase n=1 Tax=Sphingomonas sp. S1-29 TaxID=2991074 RepID=UPI00223FB395|nr:ATP-binding protein [Sphingomonas sp. S1-29]UZK69062.1 PAS domain-containing protein [Sphingomonas sp. S1-29]